MGVDYQIQEMVHQDADGVLFQALNEESGQLVAMRRFFLSEKVMEKLKERGEDGKSLFETNLEWLISLKVSHFQKVICGGIDEVDEVPYVITEWIEGMTLADAREQQVLEAKQAVVFDEQVRAVLLSFPEDARLAVSLDAEEILLREDGGGGLECQFLLSARRFFGNLGGMELKREDREAKVQELCSFFPTEEVSEGGASAFTLASASTLNSVTTPALKSARQGSGLGLLLWGSLAALALVGGVGAWFMMQKGGEESKEDVILANDQTEEKAAKGEDGPEEEVIEEVIEVEGGEEGTVASAAVRSPELGGASSDENERLEEMVRKAEEALQEGETNTRKADTREFVLEEKEIEGEVDLFGDDEPKEEESEVVKESGSLEGEDVIPVLLASEGVQRLKEFQDEQVVLEGVVERVSKSGSGIHWYLEFNRGTPDFLMVVFKQREDPLAGDYSEWETLQDKKVRVEGRSMTFTRGGKRQVVHIIERNKLEVLADMKVRSVSELASFFQDGNLGAEVVTEGTLSGLSGDGKMGFLAFEEVSEVQAYFLLGSDFGKSADFRNRLKEYKGKKVRITGRLRQDSRTRVKVAVEIEQAVNVELVE